MSNTTKIETTAQRHHRLYTTVTLRDFVIAIREDWKSGDMELSRMESTMHSELGFLNRVRGFRAFIGKHERIGRLGHGWGLKVGMPRITPNQVTAYYDIVIDWIDAKGYGNLTAQELADQELGDN